jgi:hypothetical protein
VLPLCIRKNSNRVNLIPYLVTDSEFPPYIIVRIATKEQPGKYFWAFLKVDMSLSRSESPVEKQRGSSLYILRTCCQQSQSMEKTQELELALHFYSVGEVESNRHSIKWY